MTELTPVALNSVARFFMSLRAAAIDGRLTEDVDAKFFDDAERFDEVFGADSFAMRDRQLLDHVRRVIEGSPNGVWVLPDGVKKQLVQQGL